MLNAMMNRLSMITHPQKAGRAKKYSSVWLGCRCHHMMGECPTSFDDFCDDCLFCIIVDGIWESMTMKSMADSQKWSKVIH